MPYTTNGVTHSWIYKREHRTDRFGQVVRLRCRCGAVTNWHTDDWKAKAAMYQIHEYQHKKQMEKL